jgi:hypothetical protein
MVRSLQQVRGNSNTSAQLYRCLAWTPTHRPAAGCIDPVLTLFAGDPITLSVPEAGRSTRPASAGLSSGGDDAPRLSRSVAKPCYDSVNRPSLWRSMWWGARFEWIVAESPCYLHLIAKRSWAALHPQVTKLSFPTSPAAGLSTQPSRSTSGLDDTSVDDAISTSAISEGAVPELMPTPSAPRGDGGHWESSSASLLEEVLEWVEDSAVAAALMVRPFLVLACIPSCVSCQLSVSEDGSQQGEACAWCQTREGARCAVCVCGASAQALL